MLFYYFSGKEDLYGQVLDRFLQGIRDIHVRFHEDPGPVGLQEIIAGLIRFVAANPNPVRLLIREIMDDGPQLDRIVARYVGPLFADGMAETRRNMDRGIFGSGDPMHALVNVGGLTIFYLLIVPLLRRVWERDPLAVETLEERIEATARFALRGLMAEPRPVAADSGTAEIDASAAQAAGAAQVGGVAGAVRAATAAQAASAAKAARVVKPNSAASVANVARAAKPASAASAANLARAAKPTSSTARVAQAATVAKPPSTASAAQPDGEKPTEPQAAPAAGRATGRPGRVRPGGRG
jgi:AcrR family transcriptional regulator